MNRRPDTFTRLINALKILPNIGPKSTQHMIHQPLQYKREEVQELVGALQNALRLVHHYKLCNTFCEEELCGICNDSNRSPHRLMVMHIPADISDMRTTSCHDDLYFVLMGQVSLAQGVDLSAVVFDKLIERLQNNETEEIIIIINFAAKGGAMAYVLTGLFRNLLYRVSRFAREIPLGGELEHVGTRTSARAVYKQCSIKE